MIGGKQTPYAPVRHLHTRALDTAWHHFHHGSIQWGAALNDMRAAGVSLAEAEQLLRGEDPPSLTSCPSSRTRPPSLAFALPRRVKP